MPLDTFDICDRDTVGNTHGKKRKENEQRARARDIDYFRSEKMTRSDKPGISEDKSAISRSGTRRYIDDPAKIEPP